MGGLPLTQPRQHSLAVMLNLLGDIWPAIKLGSDPNFSNLPQWGKVLTLPGVHLHLYGKSEARMGRKMGHLTITATSANKARAVAKQAATILGIAAF
jgi:5-(carboxyamino)imidazole ribonucleotide synthase